MNTIISPDCCHRGPVLAPNRWTCASTKLVIPGRAVTAELCRQCPCVNHEEEPAPSSMPRNSAEVSPDMSIEEFLNAMKAKASMPASWPWWQVAQDSFRLLFDRAASRDLSYPDRFQGRGIVMAAGGSLYFSCAFISATVLRALGCDLPIEFWHLGPDEITDEMRKRVEPLGVVCRDARDITPAPRILNGWELKPFAILHSRFEQVLFMDADNIAAMDPSHLFDDPALARHGSIFWPDLPPAVSPTTWIPTLTWDVAGIAWRDGPAFESGQLLIDKSACWHELNLTMHLNEYSDFWYRYIYGDKDTFKLAWHKMNRQYAMPTADAGWAWPAILQHDLQGRLVFTHACQGKHQLIAGEPLSALPMRDVAVQAARINHQHTQALTARAQRVHN